MNIYEMYFECEDFRNFVDSFVIKHRVAYLVAFRCMEVIEAYKAYLRALNA